MTQHTDLKPCPFCGQADNLEVAGESGYRWIVCHTDDCGAEGPFCGHDSADAVTAWNTRIPQGINAELVERLEVLLNNIGAVSLARSKFGQQLRENARATLTKAKAMNNG